MKGLVAGLMLLPLLSACEQLKNAPVPLTDTPLVGDWYGESRQQAGDVDIDSRLLIRVGADGYVDYHHLTCEQNVGRPVLQKRLDLQQMPVTRLTTVKMVLQSYPLTPKFQLTLGAWPDQNDGVWVVDQLSLKNQAGAALPTPSEWRCPAG